MELSKICEYISRRIDSSSLTVENYISTENMMQNKGGIVAASKVPAEKAVEFQPGDILISNIRPYFKKIWLADKKGGCSSDVLCIRAISGTDSSYLYYLLSQDSFFDYVMTGAKGSKMPRGDKNQIMKWEVDLPDIDEQRRIGRMLKSIDDKILLNNRINHNLEEQAQALYKSWFVDFEPFKNGKFVDSELGLVPEGWRVGIIGDIAAITSGKRPNAKYETSNADHAIPVFGASSVMAFTDSVYLTERAIITGRVGTLGILQRVDIPCWPSDNTLIIKSAYENFVFQVLRDVDYSSLNRGSTQPLLTQSDLKSWDIIIPPEGIIAKYESLIRNNADLIAGHSVQNRKLSLLRDTLLPQLMSGHITC